MPRGERPLDEGDSPLLRFAGDLRRLRADAGGPTYRELTLWDTSTWKKTGELRGHTGAVAALEFSPDSTRLASGGDDKHVVVWDLGTRSSWATLTGHVQGVTHVAWMPDGRAVVSAGSDALLVWRLDVEKALKALD